MEYDSTIISCTFIIAKLSTAYIRMDPMHTYAPRGCSWIIERETWQIYNVFGSLRKLKTGSRYENVVLRLSAKRPQETGFD